MYRESDAISVGREGFAVGGENDGERSYLNRERGKRKVNRPATYGGDTYDHVRGRREMKPQRNTMKRL